MARYSAVLFDAFNTLWYPRVTPKEVWIKVLADLGFNVPIEKVETAWESEWSLLQRQFLAFESSGHQNENSAIENMWAASEGRILNDLALTADPGEVRRITDDRFGTHFALYSETVEVLRKLRTMGMHMAIVGNGVGQSRTAERLEIADYFDAIIGSVHVGFAKPGPEIFRLALTALSVAPEEALMVGDTWEDDVVGARGAGIRAAHIVRGGREGPSSDTINDLWGVVDILNMDPLR